jgi:hypothetical protein
MAAEACAGVNFAGKARLPQQIFRMRIAITVELRPMPAANDTACGFHCLVKPGVRSILMTLIRIPRHAPHRDRR